MMMYSSWSSSGAACRARTRVQRWLGRATLLGLAFMSTTCAEEEAPALSDLDASVGVATSALGEAPEANCSWFQGPQADYWVCPTARSFQSARDKCTAVDLDLPAILDQGSNSVLRAKIGGDSWIGASDQSVENVWRWVGTGDQFWQGDEGGHAVDGAYTNWAFLQPNDYLTQDCAVMQRIDGKWGDENCGLSRRYICQSFVDQCPSDPAKTAPAQCGCGVPDTDSDGDGTADCNDACPSDPLRTEPDCTPDNDCFLVVSGGSQYFICGTRRSYASAKAQCESIGWNLVRVDSWSEASFLAFYLWDDAWAGANDLANEGQWRWDIGGDQFWNGGVFGSPVGGLYSSWFLGQPDNLLDQDCLQIEGNGQFIDDHCTESEEYICEDMCPNDTAKSLPGVCGCGVSEADSDGDGTPDCIDPDCSMPGCIQVGEGCTEDADCTALGSGSYCDLELPGGYCTVPCDGSPGSCPAGASCLGSDHCVLDCEPDQTCTDADQACAVLDPPGGAAFCRPTCALPCPPTAWCDDSDDRCVDCTSDDATCDGVDDDCDGQVDDDYIDRILDAASAAPTDVSGPETGVALFVAGLSGHGEVVDHLVERDAAAVRAHGQTALVAAAAAGDLAIVRQLLALGVSADAVAATVWNPAHLQIAPLGDDDSQRGTALMAAAYNGHAAVVTELVRAGAAIEEVTCDGATALVWAAARGHVQAARALLDGGAVVDHRTANDWTPLSVAVREGNADVAALLLGSGANPELPNREDHSARDLAERSDSVPMRELFAAHPAGSAGAQPEGR